MYLKLQNSKFLVRSDKNIRNIDYFSVLTNIIKLSYSYRNNIVLFKCDWCDLYLKERGYKYEFIFINIKVRHVS